MDMFRASGLLMHPTSFPGIPSIGCLGNPAVRFLEFLKQADQSLWQILPLGPTGYGDSPYSCYSAFAGNPVMIDLVTLFDEGLLTERPHIPGAHASFRELEEVRLGSLMQAFRRFGEMDGWKTDEYVAFEADHAIWLHDYTRFRAIKASERGRPWYEWPVELKNRAPEAMNAIDVTLRDAILFHSFLQFQFFKQWRALHEKAQALGIRIIGDMPIFVAEDSADVWSHPSLFELDPTGRPSLIAGVPPDYFSKTGQRWGNPLYRWNEIAQEGYAWWIDRFRILMGVVDVIRVDHFRGFAQYWAIPARNRTAENGTWMQGPGAELFTTLEKALGPLPVIAEDLGIITEDVTALREAFGYPGMKILQFAFGSGPDNAYLPHNYSSPRCVAYTGTHDNDTTAGWFRSLKPRRSGLRTKINPIYAHLRDYLRIEPRTIHWDLIESVLRSTAAWAIFPVQDLLGLGSDARMNVPGNASGNWMWRLESMSDIEAVQAHLKALTHRFNRCAVV